MNKNISTSSAQDPRIRQALDKAEENIFLLATMPDKRLSEKLDTIHLQKTVFGKPDLTFKKLKIAIFVDSEFWHGKDWQSRKQDHKSNQAFWLPKIERNMERDKEVNSQLLKDGWIILRFWGTDIQKNLQTCITKLFFNVAKIIKCKKPIALFLENVKGLISHDKGKKLVNKNNLGVTLSGRAFRSNLFVRTSQKGFALQSLTQNAA